MVQEKGEHLNLIEDVVVDILRAKWNSFIRARSSWALQQYNVFHVDSTSASISVQKSSSLHYLFQPRD